MTSQGAIPWHGPPLLGPWAQAGLGLKSYCEFRAPGTYSPKMRPLLLAGAALGLAASGAFAAVETALVPPEAAALAGPGAGLGSDDAFAVGTLISAESALAAVQASEPS